MRRAILAACVMLAGCQGGQDVPTQNQQGLGALASLTLWTDPSTGCRYYEYSQSWGNASVGSLSIRYRRDGTPDCPDATAKPTN